MKQCMVEIVLENVLTLWYYTFMTLKVDVRRHLQAASNTHAKTKLPITSAHLPLSPNLIFIYKHRA